MTMTNYQKIHPNLPIFIIPLTTHCVWYCAGKIWVLTHEESSQWQSCFDKYVHRKGKVVSPAINELYYFAQHSLKHWQALFKQQFNPECLTVYISYDCNLNCSYCYSKGKRKPTGVKVDLKHVEAAARCVAQACQENQRDFVLVLHGGGEPTYHWSHMQAVYGTVKEVASEHGLGLYCYISTNGLFDQQQAVWLAKNIRNIGLSCDGPQHIQAIQRHSEKSPNQTKVIKENARIILEEGGQLNVRATITPESSPYQSDIVTFISEELRVRLIRFEPVYGQKETGFHERHANQFVHNFLLAQEKARERNGCLSYSGVRLQELHSTYCDVLRNTLRLSPEGMLSNCFFYPIDHSKPLLRISQYNRRKQAFDISLDHIAQVKQLIATRPNKCASCINQLHCSLGCPDTCPIYNPQDQEDFRCRINHQLALNWIRQAAEKVLSDKHGQYNGFSVECC